MYRATNSHWLLVGLLAVLLSLGVQASEESPDDVARRIGSGNPVAGKLKSDTELCQGCHGETGVNAVSSYPKLTGQYADYLVKQLRNFKTGVRQHPVMNGMAEHISDTDMADIAAYFASNEGMQSNATSTGASSNDLAKSLFTKGDLKRDVLPCASCHGEGGKGAMTESDIYPVIGGQHKLYLREQLLNWRSGARSNGTGGVMNFITKSLTDTEIDALSQYIAELK
jgi:cytochrome c553